MSNPNRPEPSSTPTGRTALVVGASGIAGSALRDLLSASGWEVLALSRSAAAGQTNVRHLQADLTSPSSLRQALAAENPSHVFFTAWSRQPTEQQNIEVNAGMLRDLLAALEGKEVQHVALMTGLKHYLGPFEAYAAGEMPDTPFREEEPRLPVDNFYYAQEDELRAAAEKAGFTWSVHRAHTVIGHAVGNAMNMGLTLAVQAALCREQGRPFVFPGSETQWNGLTDMTDAGLLAEHMLWAATHPAGANEAFNVVNGDTFRWRRMWPHLAAYFGVEAEGYRDAPRPLEVQMAGMDEVWQQMAQRYALAENRLDRVASWWHTDGDLGRNIEVVTDMSKSRLAGFSGYRRTADAFTALFDRYRDERLIP
ncbi:SDR family oxidoreductase [Paenarthrobacter sp. DKR-5]|uniref:SDR family oxidoreductase n=1 Tax=Paenarthrobacter sp. DKR-5 TaxID=2835535 RepID=UPI001BDC2556|nr:SDR family oxidoreductase [Paenarthrobacter sp. DKR-5]MBT1001812.1 SDR family oxidoreductase [Paenarthrobacter sp. DKR-5]